MTQLEIIAKHKCPSCKNGPDNIILVEDVGPQRGQDIPREDTDFDSGVDARCVTCGWKGGIWNCNPWY